jgi:hypothetical protein
MKIIEAEVSSSLPLILLLSSLSLSMTVSTTSTSIRLDFLEPNLCSDLRQYANIISTLRRAGDSEGKGGEINALVLMTTAGDVVGGVVGLSRLISASPTPIFEGIYCARFPSLDAPQSRSHGSRSECLQR